MSARGFWQRKRTLRAPSLQRFSPTACEKPHLQRTKRPSVERRGVKSDRRRFHSVATAFESDNGTQQERAVSHECSLLWLGSRLSVAFNSGVWSSAHRLGFRVAHWLLAVCHRGWLERSLSIALDGRIFGILAAFVHDHRRASHNRLRRRLSIRVHRIRALFCAHFFRCFGLI